MAAHNESESLGAQLATARKLFSEVSTDDRKVLSDYGWTFVKVLLQNISEIDSLTARQLLADCIKLPLERPSRFHSALLAAAIKVALAYPEFHFATFLKMWGMENLRPEDKLSQMSDGKVFLSLEERAIRTLAHSLLLHPEDRQLLQTSGFGALLSSNNLSILPMLVTRIKQASGKDGRKYTFVTLTSPEGIETECISHSLQPSPLHPLPEGKRHYVNIGQLYDVLLRSKAPVPKASALATPAYTLLSSCLSAQRPSDIFPTEIGYIEHIDTEHSHMHVYDCHSRHFVAPIQRFSREKEGDFVRFIPIVPQASKFKTAILVATVPSSSEDIKNILRDIRITSINKEKGYAAWELVNKQEPITEQLSPLQLSQGETSPTFTSGYLNFTIVPDASPSGFTATVPDASASGIPTPLKAGWEGPALIYLKRGKDKQKRPHVAKLFNTLVP
ncbi:MAG: hypothetical protein MJZ41_14315 [Bacteroidaceae bacterium]|nr:hypothetical protein [Bacteroidaceae bacterium]